MTATTHHRRLNRKELRQPDEFMTFMDSAGEFVASNLARVIAGVVALVIVVLVIVGSRFYVAQKTRAAAEGFYQASEAYDHQNYAAAIAQFTNLANKYPHTAPGRLAHLYIGDALLQQNQPAKARPEIEKFLAETGNDQFRDLALVQLGAADENMADLQGAQQAYEKAARIGGPERGRAQLNAARVMAIRGDKHGAIAAYQRFLSENPFAQERGEVIDALAQLGAAPPKASSLKTIELPATK